ncbi:RICIN domain-containing protein [Actinokineospora globicatena]|uniref:Ricin B lectin domain-containing protein n=1 Tax=Actinokineospora globicatena TaxID=103729 RepID=A0A9W6QRE1_9PSEU|nr:RICIN domain-containing protein [Actinokineospora globicatena]MCP2301896.1 Ricin-type beta-trefoil lectin domain-like [Actinokineospora globicatena]GLW76445.1 hypothetical protein Aglo01_09270 [Actinokineospora globicatena]GLW83280.1 hypothetical protein Aglo02_09200 [Actinokineospora globicatena]GLW94736.1 hypothetical protein Aglo03_55520 [Actinokineospora globicatena]
MKARNVVAVVIGAVGGLLAAVLPAAADEFGTWHELKPRSSDKCLDVDGGSTEDGANAIQYTCHGGTNQQWQLVLVDSSDVFAISAGNSGKCLDVEGGATNDGANVIQWECHGGKNQQWQLVPLGAGLYEIRSVNSDKCLDVDGGSTEDGANIIQWPCHGGDNQAWSLTNV